MPQGEAAKLQDVGRKGRTFLNDRSYMVRSDETAMSLLALRSRIEDQELTSILADVIHYSGWMFPTADEASSEKAKQQTMDAIKRYHQRVDKILPDLY